MGGRDRTMQRRADELREGAMRWDAGSWFGAQVGSSVWMLLLAILLLGRGRSGLALVALGAFALPNAVGIVLWRRRARLAAYPAVQGLLAVTALASAVALVALDRGGLLAEPWVWPGGWSAYLVLLLFPLLMGILHLRERSYGNAKTR
jgi:hypothetical protein